MPLMVWWWAALWKLIEDYFWWIFVSILGRVNLFQICTLFFFCSNWKIYAFILFEWIGQSNVWMDRTVKCFLYTQIYYTSADFHCRKITFKLSSHHAKTTAKPTSPENCFVTFWNFYFWIKRKKFRLECFAWVSIFKWYRFCIRSCFCFCSVWTKL